MKKIIFVILVFLLLPGVFSATYYIKNGGNDNANGLSDATAWKTSDNLRNLRTGDDVYFKAGDVWDEQFNIRWDGTASNRAVVGSYYMRNGEETIGVPDGTSKPTFKGTYEKDGDLIHGNGAVPAGQWQGMVSIDGSYVTVQNLRIENSAGESMDIRNDKIGRADHHHVIVENNEMIVSAGACFSFERGTHTNIVRNNEMTGCGFGWKNRDLPWQLAGGSGGYPGCVVMSLSNYNIFENNYVHECYGEVIAVIANSQYNIIRGNVAANVRASIRLDNGPNNLVEHNMIFGNPGNPEYDFNGHNPDGYTSGITIAVEDYNNAYDTVNVVIRNNLLVNTGTCLTIGMEPAAKAKNAQVGGHFIGNTCINPGVSGVGNEGNLRSGLIGELVVKNNIIDKPIQPRSDMSMCNFNVDSDIIIEDNVWGELPADEDCRSDGDVIGEVEFKRSNWDSTGPDDWPHPSDFELVGNSIARGVGGPTSKTVLSLSDFPQFSELQNKCSNFDTKQRSNDYYCNEISEYFAGAIAPGSSGEFPDVNGPPSSNPDRSCSLLDENSDIPNGFGAPTIDNELFFKGKCDDRSVDVEIDGSIITYVYENGYYWDGNSWEGFKLNGNNVDNSPWLNSDADYTINGVDTSESIYTLVYACKWNGSEWKCGCRDQSCNQNYWNLQIFKN